MAVFCNIQSEYSFMRNTQSASVIVVLFINAQDLLQMGQLAQEASWANRNMFAPFRTSDTSFSVENKHFLFFSAHNMRKP